MEVKTETVQKIVQRTIIYVAVILIIYYITLQSGYIIPPDLGGEYLEIHMFFWPMLAALALKYSQEIIDILLIGQYIPHMVKALKNMAILIPVWLFSTYYEELSIVSELMFYIAVLVTGYFLMNILQTYSRKNDNYALQLVTRFFYTVFNGFILSIAWKTLAPSLTLVGLSLSSGIISGISSLILLSSLTAAFLSLTVLAENNENPYVATFAKRISIRPSENFIQVFTLLAYLFYVRPQIDVYFSEYSKYLPYFEWGIIVFTAFLSFRNLRSYIQNDLTRVDVMGKLQKHLQEIETSSDYRIDNLTKSVNNFIERGEKEVLLMYLANILSKNSASALSSANALHELIYYKPKELELITFRWNKEQAHLQDMAKRKEILSQVLPIIQQLSYRQDGIEEEIMIRGDTI